MAGSDGQSPCREEVNPQVIGTTKGSHIAALGIWWLLCFFGWLVVCWWLLLFGDFFLTTRISDVYDESSPVTHCPPPTVGVTQCSSNSRGATTSQPHAGVYELGDFRCHSVSDCSYGPNHPSIMHEAFTAV